MLILYCTVEGYREHSTKTPHVVDVKNWHILIKVSVPTTRLTPYISRSNTHTPTQTNPPPQPLPLTTHTINIKIIKNAEEQENNIKYCRDCRVGDLIWSEPVPKLSSPHNESRPASMRLPKNFQPVGTSNISLPSSLATLYAQ